MTLPCEPKHFLRTRVKVPKHNQMYKNIRVFSILIGRFNSFSITFLIEKFFVGDSWSVIYIYFDNFLLKLGKCLDWTRLPFGHLRNIVKENEKRPSATC